LCKYYIQNKQCPLYPECPYAHNQVEKSYHPSNYRKRLCKLEENCQSKDICVYAHSRAELTINRIDELPRDQEFYVKFYKTVFCPFQHEHNRAGCVFAHNFQDFRRDVRNYNYSITPCKQWKKKKEVYKYSDGCRNGMNCKFAHGWKERDFHPSRYMKEVCDMNGSCDRPHCPFIHTELQFQANISRSVKTSKDMTKSCISVSTAEESVKNEESAKNEERISFDLLDSEKKLEYSYNVGYDILYRSIAGVDFRCWGNAFV